MARFRQRSVLVQAVRIRNRVTIDTSAGILAGEVGDWLITGVSGEHRLYSDDVFRATHEPVTVEAQDMIQED